MAGIGSLVSRAGVDAPGVIRSRYNVRALNTLGPGAPAGSGTVSTTNVRSSAAAVTP